MSSYQLEEGAPLVGEQLSAAETSTTNRQPISLKLALAGLAAASIVVASIGYYSGTGQLQMIEPTQLDTVSPVPVVGANAQVINGKIYGLLQQNKNNNYASMSYVCNGGDNFRMPSGWEVCPDNAETATAIRAYGWNAHVLYTSSGCAYGTAQYSQGLWSCNYMTQENRGDGYTWVNSRVCSSNVLICQGAPSPTPAPISNPTAVPLAAPTLQPSLEPTDAPVGEPTLSPTVMATEEPKEEADFCDFTFMKGESSDEVAAGCVLFAAKDLNLLKVGEESDAIYGCAGPKAPLRITSNILSKWHGLGQVSWLKAGGDATAVMYDGEFAGNELTFNDESEDHSLVNKRFAKGSTANDNVKTILVTSEGAALSKLSEECESHLA